MLRTPTVFVVGAGASRELRFPTGEELLEQIAKCLDFRDNYSNIEGGAPEVWYALAQASARSGINPFEYLRAAWRVRDAAHLGLSIDNVVHQQFDDPLVVHSAKIAIARQLLLAEDKSDLRIHDNTRTTTWPKVRGTWLGRFAQLLVQDIDRNSIDKIFDNISIISFNYDRTIRRFLPNVLVSQFAIEEPAAIEISKSLRIFHPYGSLGPLQWEDGASPTLFGMPDRANLLNVAGNLRTFTERLEHSDELSEMRKALSEAERIVFLGFGYLAQNMEILTSGVVGCANVVMGTSYGLSPQDTDVVSGQLREFFRESQRSYKDAILYSATCEEFIRQNFRTLTS